MQKLLLNGTWQLRGEFLDVLASDYGKVLNREKGEFSILKRTKEKAFPSIKGWIDTPVPGDVLCGLKQANIINEPLENSNLEESYFTKNFSWWYKKEFIITEEMYNNEELRLFIEMLDFNASIIINGNKIYEHKNAFVAFNENIKKYLSIGENFILIRLTSGLELHNNFDSVSYYCAGDFGIEDARVHLRKPQFTYGWDWCKPVATCGIGRDIYIEPVSGATITNFNMFTNTVSVEEKNANINIHFEIDNLRMYSCDDALLEYTIYYDDKVVVTSKKDLYLVGGINFIDENINIKNAKLWWPNGYGEQSLYKIKASVTCRNTKNEMGTKIFGIRTIILNQDKLEEDTREFKFIVNGVKVLCKGGNWVPTDSIYLRTKDETYKTLVDEAKACNFTMLRMWGGGTYEPECFYTYCSENGIMLMHDFMYACGFYPDHIDSFLHEAKKEADYQTKRLSYFPCMAIWTGNNEIHEAYTNWYSKEEEMERFYGAKIFNYYQPEAVYKNSPKTPYLPCSPFGGELANAQNAGDSHVWGWLLYDKENGFKYPNEPDAFDRLTTRFSSEFGFWGPLPKSSVEKYHGNNKVAFDGDDYKFHGESTQKRDSILGSVNRYLKDTGENLQIDEYILYGTVMQGMLYRYMCEALRHKTYGSGYLIWMYNDCWPETGWTVIDYYLTRKNSFYLLKEALDPFKMTIRIENNKAILHITNETNVDKNISLLFAFQSYDGQNLKEEKHDLVVNKHSFNSEIILDLNGINEENGFAYARVLNDSDFNSAISLHYEFKKYQLKKSSIEVISEKIVDKNKVVKIKANEFSPCVYVTGDNDEIHFSSNYIHLVKDEEREIIALNYTGDLNVNCLELG